MTEIIFRIILIFTLVMTTPNALPQSYFNEKIFIEQLITAGENGEINKSKIDGVPLIIYYLSSSPTINKDVLDAFIKYRASFDHFNEFNFAICQSGTFDAVKYFIEKSVALGFEYKEIEQLRCLEKFAYRGEADSFILYYNSISKRSLSEKKADELNELILSIESSLRELINED